MRNAGGATRRSAARPLSVHVPSSPETTQGADDPMSPTGRVMEDIGLHIVVMMGISTPVNLSVFRAGIESEVIPRFPRFSSIMVMDGKPRWVKTIVNVDDHIVIPKLDPAMVASDPDKVVEDYVSSLSLLPMDKRRPLWEFHFLDFPTSGEVASTIVLRLHHSIGDGMSINTLMMASSRSTADPERPPALPPPPKRSGAIYQRGPRPQLSSGNYLALLLWVWSYLVLVWHTIVDVAMLAATVLFLRDPHTVFMREDGGEPHRRKRFVHRSLSLDDVKLIKTAMNCTINDVIVGLTSAALSQYYFRKSGDTKSKRICLRSFVLVNTRPVSSREIYVTKAETGNQLSSLICPLHMVLHDDPLEYVREAKMFMHRKKGSLEVLFTRLFGEFLVKYFGVKAGTFLMHRFVTRTTIVLSNAVGPAEHITFCGHPIAYLAPSVYGQPQALTMHYVNYGSTMKVILSVDDAQFSDYLQLLDDFDESIKNIKNAASLKTLITSIKND